MTLSIAQFAVAAQRKEQNRGRAVKLVGDRAAADNLEAGLRKADELAAHIKPLLDAVDFAALRAELQEKLKAHAVKILDEEIRAESSWRMSSPGDYGSNNIHHGNGIETPVNSMRAFEAYAATCERAFQALEKLKETGNFRTLERKHIAAIVPHVHHMPDQTPGSYWHFGLDEELFGTKLADFLEGQISYEDTPRDYHSSTSFGFDAGSLTGADTLGEVNKALYAAEDLGETLVVYFDQKFQAEQRENLEYRYA